MTLNTTALDTVMLGVVYASVFEQIVANKPSVVMLSVMLPNGAIQCCQIFFRNPPNFSQMSPKSSQIFFLIFHKVKFWAKHNTTM